jgi:periplasmic iron binding protein
LAQFNVKYVYMRINRTYMGRMRTLWAACALLVAVPTAEAAVLGGPLLRDGLEIVPSTLSGVELDRSPTAMGSSPDSVFLVADVHATRDEAHGFPEHAFIPFLSISYFLTKDDAPTFKKVGLLYPIAGKSGPQYAAAADLAGPGTYHLIYIIYPPSSHGMLRRTDKAGGVPDWWNPITANWNFTYPTSAK